MAKLTKAQADFLTFSIFSKMEKAKDFLMDDKTLICRKGTVSCGDASFKNEKGEQINSITKEYGSELVNLFTAIENLQTFFNIHG